MEAIKFEPILKEMIWGGDRISQLLKIENKNKIGENWTLSFREQDTSVVAEGKYSGRSLKDLVESNKKEMLGDLFLDMETFPLLVKIIHAKDNLSIQVHPNDFYALNELGLPYGKTEMWYIIEAEPDTKLVAGLKAGVTKEVFEEAICNKTVMDCLNFVDVKKGDVIDIPAGLVHAITSGLLIAEIQQNSDTTFRVYDYERVDANGNQRELHIDRALDVIDFTGKLKSDVITGETTSVEGAVVTKYINNDYFTVDKYVVNNNFKDSSLFDRFSIITVVDGAGVIKFGEEELVVNIGETVFIPAYLGDYEVSGNLTILKSIPKK